MLSCPLPANVKALVLVLLPFRGGTLAMRMLVSSSWIELRVCLLVRGHPLHDVSPGCVSVAVPGEHSPGSNAVNVAVLGEHSRRSDGAAAGPSPRTTGLLQGIETDVSKNLAICWYDDRSCGGSGGRSLGAWSST